jgi:hypothetical protein
MTYKEALEKIATVNAMDYEYQAWARDALAKQEQGEPIRGLVKELMRQIEIGDFVDGHGHSAKMLDAVQKLNKELKND